MYLYIDEHYLILSCALQVGDCCSVSNLEKVLINLIDDDEDDVRSLSLASKRLVDEGENKPN